MHGRVTQQESTSANWTEPALSSEIPQGYLEGSPDPSGSLLEEKIAYARKGKERARMRQEGKERGCARKGKCADALEDAPVGKKAPPPGLNMVTALADTCA